MGFFGKIKNILFEDDDEVEEMPVYTKEEVKEVTKVKEEVAKPSLEDEPIKSTEHYRFSNVKRDIDLNYDEKDVLGEVPGASEIIDDKPKQEDVKPVENSKPSIFMSFDEEEFERLNSRVIKNENKAKREVKSIGTIGTPVAENNSDNNMNVARRANNNFSSTSTSRDTRMENTERYKINSGTLGSGKKPFTPSPVISPVYGILDKNYTKEDIIDRKDGLKREKIVKPIVKKKEEQPVQVVQEKDNVYEVDIDSVRKKAYGSLEELEKTLTKIEIPELKEEKKVETNNEQEVKIVEDQIDKQNELSIEDQLEETVVDNNLVEDEIAEKVDVVEHEVVEDKKEENPEGEKKSKLLDEMEKTSTLQILDDIEKELNSIKPITKDKEKEEEQEEQSLVSDDTLESDLFNLIDSMYEEGEEEEND